jgi:hypothetical protein
VAATVLRGFITGMFISTVSDRVPLAGFSAAVNHQIFHYCEKFRQVEQAYYLPGNRQDMRRDALIFVHEVDDLEWLRTMRTNMKIAFRSSFCLLDL